MNKNKKIAKNYAYQIKELIKTSGKKQEDIASEISDCIYADTHNNEKEVSKFKNRFRKTLSEALKDNDKQTSDKTLEELKQWYEYLSSKYDKYSYRKEILGEDIYNFFYKD
ncbi:hypothetical protein [Campylobacter sp. 2018MI13]|uniref:hypothetical protein n=1 Tax=Campylobacter sp. 2018MI13 TaxID=2836737 RepID=UPI001BDA4077|nr:hypothetical protein [Campylobacter sp. 2018MI13]MBT0882128.1 hypothetical protein [Campylobacter sp. 2018MI13]